ncbi:MULTISPECIES: O-methyltransferase [Bacillota]|jgi:predicted O-methyltransferase YrrM|uniref:O-methyltransferase n=2 Tax=Amedibacillus TaxID=2749846 RepID=A0A7G9GT86_9FIRM|nr:MULTISPECIES: O-methyltransferase [Bacillota]QNM14018.1 O-methyltransferase [[Eubacterium] hominis]MCH4285884.1 O-methyltransferase [Amedibacillus hominis]RGB50194.1 O-methyltransferase [Absiella sp. AM22-9]RGB56965.1 O-methyltransferase [Absiella sp. AM10-20]RGB66850.1 O-methyltransferase [Absiella sp. AM09-45]
MTLLEEMEQYALEKDVPIMLQEGITFMCSFIKEHQLKSILEIGSAIGYSAIRMAMLDKNIHITTIERDEERYQKAKEYIARSEYKDQITLLYGDALEADIQGSYDMIFIDAAKAQYIRFFERYEPLLIQGGYIITDNLKFHGFVEHPETATSRNLRQLVGKISRFINYLKSRDDFDTTFLEQGDGIGISKKK